MSLNKQLQLSKGYSIALALALVLAGVSNGLPQAQKLSADLNTVELTTLNNVKPELSELESDAATLQYRDSSSLQAQTTEFSSEIPKESEDALIMGNASKEELRFTNHNAREVDGIYTQNKILYRDLWNNTDLLLKTTKTGVKEHLILKNNSAPTRFEYLIETVNLRLNLTPDGGFELLDTRGNKKFYTPPPDLTDSEGTYTTTGISYRLGWEEDGIQDTDTAEKTNEDSENIESETNESVEATTAETETSEETTTSETTVEESSGGTGGVAVVETLDSTSSLQADSTSSESEAETLAEEATTNTGSEAETSTEAGTTESEEVSEEEATEEVEVSTEEATTEEEESVEDIVESTTEETNTDTEEAVAETTNETSEVGTTEEVVDTEATSSEETTEVVEEVVEEEVTTEPIEEIETSNSELETNEVEAEELSTSILEKFFPKLFQSSLLDFENSTENYTQTRQADGSILRQYKLSLVVETATLANLTYPLDLDPSVYIEGVSGSDATVTTSLGQNIVTNDLTVNGNLNIDGANLNIDSDTLYIDAENGRVGIGTSSPSASLGINGNMVVNDGNNNLVINGYETTIGGSENTFLNVWAGNVGGVQNTAIGAGALNANTSGYRNTAIGTYALVGNLTGESNTALGYQAMNNRTEGSGNLAVGDRALKTGTTGGHNTAVGSFSGSSITTGSNNITIGYSAQVASADGDNQLSIGNTIYGDLSAGFVGIGTTAPTSSLEVKGSGATSATSSLNITDSAGASKLFVRDDGNVGVGATAPEYKLDVTEATSKSPVVFRTAYNAGGNILAEFFRTGTTFGRAGMIGMAGNDSNPMVYLGFENSLGGGSGYAYAGVDIYNSYLKGVGATLTIGPITGNTLNSVTYSQPILIGQYEGAEKFRFTKDGYLGIGTTSPVAKLDVDGAIRTRANTKGDCASADDVGKIAYEESGDVGTFYGCRRTGASAYEWVALH